MDLGIAKQPCCTLITGIHEPSYPMQATTSPIQLQQLNSKAPPQIKQLAVVQGAARRKVVVDPLRALLHRDVRIVDRVQDPVEPDLRGVELHEVRREVARGRLEDVVLEVEGHVFLHRHARGDLAQEF